MNVNNEGWICPLCRAGVAPTVERCPCAMTTSPPSQPPYGPSLPTYQPACPRWPWPDVTCESPRPFNVGSDGMLGGNLDATIYGDPLRAARP